MKGELTMDECKNCVYLDKKLKLLLEDWAILSKKYQENLKFKFDSKQFSKIMEKEFKPLRNDIDTLILAVNSLGDKNG